MSQFSGKCDFADHIEVIGLERTLKCKVYLGNEAEDKLLKLNSYEDCIPYLPHIISRSYGDIIVLTSKSWVDIENEKTLTFILESLQKKFRYYKRKKLPPNIEEIKKQVAWCSNVDIVDELIKRIQKYGNKATIEGLETSSCKYWKRKLEEEKEKYGLE